MNEAFAAAMADIRLALKAGDMALAVKLANTPLSAWEAGGHLHKELLP